MTPRSRVVPSKRPSAVDATAETLARLGAHTVFGLVGSGNFRLVERLTRRHGAAYQWARHETAAVTMTDAWSRVTGRVGICSLHQGPGLTNAVTGLTEASKAHTQMLVMVGEVATTAGEVNQRIDQEAVAAATGAGVARVSSGASAVRDTVQACQRALAERRPIVLSFPIDLQEQPCEPPGDDLAVEARSAAEPASAQVSSVVAQIESADRPLVLGGRGAVLAGAGPALEALADRIGALLATSAPANGLFATSPWSLGISGGFASPLAQRLIPQADLVLSFGAGLNRWTARSGELIGPQTDVVLCDDDPGALNEHWLGPTPLLGDARLAAEMLEDELRDRGFERQGFRAECDAESLADRGWRIRDESRPGMVDPRVVMMRLDEKLPAQRGVVTDGGHFQGFPPQHLSVPDAQAFVMTQAFQAVGLGMATGIGAVVARPDRPTIAVVGDGGLMMSLGELDSAASQGLPLLVVVLDDGAYGAEVHHFGPMGEETGLVEFGSRDFAGVAEALGAGAITVTSVDDLDAGELDAWVSDPDGTFVLDCKVDPEIRAEWLQEAFRGGA